MGYDMTMVAPTPDLIEARDRDRAEFDAAVKARDDYLSDGGRHGRDDPEWRERWESDEGKRRQEAVLALGNADPTYFRLNIWGMSTMRRIMDEAGLMNYVDAPRDHPEPPEDEDAYEDWRESPEVRGFYSQGGENGTVPAFKFGSNDGWVVTPDECRTLAEGLRQFADPITDEETGWRLEEGPFAGKYVDMDAMRRVLRALGKGDLPSDFEVAVTSAITRDMPDDAELVGPEDAPTVPGEPSEDPEIAREQAVEAFGWMRTTMAFAEFNERAAECGGYEVY